MIRKSPIDAEKRIRQGLTPYPDHEILIHNLVEGRIKELKRDSWMTAVMFLLVGILIALLGIIVLLEITTLG